MDHAKKLELLDQQIAQARNGQPEDFELWKQKTDVVLRNVIGDASPLYDSFKTNRYPQVSGQVVWTFVLTG